MHGVLCCLKLHVQIAVLNLVGRDIRRDAAKVGHALFIRREILEFGETDGAIDAFLRKKLSGRTLDQKTIKKAVDALIRRGHSYHDIQEGLRRLEADCEPIDTWEDME